MPSLQKGAAFLVIGDLAVLALSLWLALGVRAGMIPEFAFLLAHLQVFIFIFGVSIIIFFISGLYEKKARIVRRIIGIRIIGAQIATSVLAALVFFALPLTIAPKTTLALYLGISILLMTIWRSWAVPFIAARNVTHVCFLTSGAVTNELVEDVRGNSLFSVAVCDEMVAPDSDAFLKQIHAADIVVVEVDPQGFDERVISLYAARRPGTVIVEVADFYETVRDKVSLSYVDQQWIHNAHIGRPLIYDLAKRVVDICGAIIGIILAIIPLALATIAIQFSGGGSAIIKHERVGRGGKTFTIYKLRTMLLNDHGDPELRARNRVTPLGAFFRKSRIDELPQLINILKGDLSFIGPRPELPILVEEYEQEIPYYSLRHTVTPGLSGWAQLHHMDAPRGGVDVVRTREKLEYDLYYVKYRTFALDVAIALKTVRTLLSFSGK